jgi:predicted MFS family arabinose efflux permease
MVAAFVGKAVAGMQIVAGADVGPAAMGWLAFTFAASLCGHLLAIVITSESTSLVPDDRRGTLMGLEHGGFSAARVVGPSLGITLMEGGAFWHVDAAIVAIYGGVFAYWLMPRTAVAPAKGAKAKDE